MSSFKIKTSSFLNLTLFWIKLVMIFNPPQAVFINTSSDGIVSLTYLYLICNFNPVATKGFLSTLIRWVFPHYLKFGCDKRSLKCSQSSGLTNCIKILSRSYNATIDLSIMGHLEISYIISKAPIMGLFSNITIFRTSRAVFRQHVNPDG